MCDCPHHPFGCYDHPNRCGCNETVTINLLVSKAEKKRLTEIAKLDGKSLSSMLREAALVSARRVLAEFKPDLLKE